MKISKIGCTLLLMSFVMFSCEINLKDKTKEAKEISIAKAEVISLNLSGMSCELGCAKTIESKLAKKEGVIEAKIIFSDSLATIKYDINKTNKTDLIAFVEDIGNSSGHTYKVTESDKKVCSSNCKKECCTMDRNETEKKSCTKDCKKECCTGEKV